MRWEMGTHFGVNRKKEERGQARKLHSTRRSNFRKGPSAISKKI